MQNISVNELYLICQFVHEVTGYANGVPTYNKNNEDELIPPNFFAYESFSDKLVHFLDDSFPKRTSFHLLIEECIVHLCEYQANQRHEIEVLGEGFLLDKIIDDLGIRELDIDYSGLNKRSNGNVMSRIEKDLRVSIPDMMGLSAVQLAAQQVFYILFGNRHTLQKFNILCSAIRSKHRYENSKRCYINRWAERAVFYREKGKCALCMKDVSGTVNTENRLNFDHIVPLAKGGLNCVTNLQILCAGCNASKGARSEGTSYSYSPWY